MKEFGINQLARGQINELMNEKICQDNKHTTKQLINSYVEMQKRLALHKESKQLRNKGSLIGSSISEQLYDQQARIQAEQVSFFNMQGMINHYFYGFYFSNNGKHYEFKIMYDIPHSSNQSPEERYALSEDGYDTYPLKELSEMSLIVESKGLESFKRKFGIED